MPDMSRPTTNEKIAAPITPRMPPAPVSSTDSTMNCFWMSPRACAEGLAHPDLLDAFGDGHEHDVHDHHAAHQQADRGDHDRDHVDALGGAVPKIHHALPGFDVEVVGIAVSERWRRLRRASRAWSCARSKTSIDRASAWMLTERRDPNILRNAVIGSPHEIVLALVRRPCLCARPRRPRAGGCRRRCSLFAERLSVREDSASIEVGPDDRHRPRRVDVVVDEMTPDDQVADRADAAEYSRSRP
jgi:hypothetical protein